MPSQKNPSKAMWRACKYQGEWAVLAPNGAYVLFGKKKDMFQRASELNAGR